MLRTVAKKYTFNNAISLSCASALGNKLEPFQSAKFSSNAQQKKASTPTNSSSASNSKLDIPSIFSGPQKKMLQEKNEQEAFCAQQKTMVDRIFYAPIAVTEKQIRKDLMTAHRLMAKYNYDDLVWNHISARCGATAENDDEECCDINPNTYLITPGGVHFSEIREEDLVFDSIEENGNIIHSGIYAKRKDVRAIIHAHTPSVMAVGVLEDGFMHLTQDSAAFYKKIGYHDWEGYHTSDEEKERVAKNLGQGDILFLRNHGAVVVGRSIQEAFVKYYYLERCCRVQLDAMSTGRKLRPMPEDMMEQAAAQLEKYFPHGKYEWRALSRLVEPKA